MTDWADMVADTNDEAIGDLWDDWGAPPFTVLDTRAGRWKDRRQRWLSLGLQSEIGRDGRAFSEDLMRAERDRDYTPQRIEDGRQLQPGRGNHRTDYGSYDGGPNPGVSIFDPVLCELVYRWFAPPGGTVLDPFAGGSVRGIVASYLGHPYVGVDLSGRQLAANVEQWSAMADARLLPATAPVPSWHQGDSLHLADLVGPLQADLVFSCPPYYDLEVYSEDPRDLSAMDTYGDFLGTYRTIIANAVAHLAPGRFAVLVVSEVRDKRGHLRGLVPDTIRALEDAGCRFYNEAVLVNSAGSLPLRVGQPMTASRKLGRSHQNVVVAYRDPDLVAELPVAKVLVATKGTPDPRPWSTDRQDAPQPQLDLWA